MSNFCTLFDSNYLTRGLAMIDSISKTSSDFKMYVVCFDSLAFQILTALSLKNVILISLEEFETNELLQVKKERTTAEYCWTCTPFAIRFVLESFKLEVVTYVDADLYFFQNPLLLLEEFNQSGGSVLITEHRYTPEYDQTAESGIYCVQFMTFRADQTGLRVLQWWQDRCLEWCYARAEDGKFGDQKYLDNWPSQFEGVYVLRHLGGGVAPWNVQQYKVGSQPTINDIPVIFYHYHGLKWYTNNTFDLGEFLLSLDVIKYLYRPYVNSLKRQLELVKSLESAFDAGRIKSIFSLKAQWLKLKRQLRGNYNVLHE